MKIPVMAMLAVLALPLAVRAEAQAGSIDWQKRLIKCKGSGAPNPAAPTIAAARLGAEKAAKMDAMRNILETLKGVQVTGAKTAGDLLQDPGVSSKVQGVIRNYRIADTRYYDDGGVEVDVEMPLDGLVDSLVPPGEKKGEAPAKPVGTGLVVDAKGLGAAPALAPRILDEEGAEVYGPATAAAAKNGLAAYAPDVESAKKDPRVAGEPVVVKAIALAKGSSCDVVIAKADAEKARKAKLSDGNVVFVLQ